MTNQMRLTLQGLKVLRLFIEWPRRTLSGADIMRESGLPSGTVYPLLMRLKESGFLSGKWENKAASVLGRPRRRMYVITSIGRVVAGDTFQKLGVACISR